MFKHCGMRHEAINIYYLILNQYIPNLQTKLVQFILFNIFHVMCRYLPTRIIRDFEITLFNIDTLLLDL